MLYQDEIKPCPCKSPHPTIMDVEESGSNVVGQQNIFYVRCVGCRATSSRYNDPLPAFMDWNRRISREVR